MVAIVERTFLLSLFFSLIPALIFFSPIFSPPLRAKSRLSPSQGIKTRSVGNRKQWSLCSQLAAASLFLFSSEAPSKIFLPSRPALLVCPPPLP